MKKSLTLIICLVFSFASISQETIWTTVKSTEMAYRIDFPGEAISKSQDVPTNKRNAVMNSYQLQKNGGENIINMTSFSEYPESFFPDGLNTLEKQTAVLNRSVNGTATSTKGTLVSDEKIVFNGYNGRKVKISLNSGVESFIISMKIVLVNFKIYLTQIISYTGKENNLDSARFFNSFELINVNQ